MDTIIFVLIIVSLRFLLYELGKHLNRERRWLWAVIIFLGIVCIAAPIILIKKNLLSNSVENTLLAGFAMFYFAHIVGKISNNLSK